MDRRLDLHSLLTEARAGLHRLTPAAALDAMRHGALLLDTRQDTDRWRDGGVAGAVHVPRTVLEWRVDPAGGAQHPLITGFGQVLVVMCNEGYSSSLAAHTLQRLGFAGATDMIDGFAGWRRAGLPVEPLRPPSPRAPSGPA